MRRCKVFALAKTKLYESSVLKIGRCSQCKRLIVSLEKVDFTGRKTCIRKYGLQAQLLYERNKFNILYEIAQLKSGKFGFYLNYQEYGKVKKCYSNLRTLKLGKMAGNFEDVSTKDKVLNINEFYNKQQSLCQKCS
jgi:hypothetical protein